MRTINKNSISTCWLYLVVICFFILTNIFSVALADDVLKISDGISNSAANNIKIKDQKCSDINVDEEDYKKSIYAKDAFKNYVCGDSEFIKLYNIKVMLRENLLLDAGHTIADFELSKLSDQCDVLQARYFIWAYFLENVHHYIYEPELIKLQNPINLQNYNCSQAFTALVSHTVLHVTLNKSVYGEEIYEKVVTEKSLETLQGFVRQGSQFTYINLIIMEAFLGDNYEQLYKIDAGESMNLNVLEYVNAFCLDGIPQMDFFRDKNNPFFKRIEVMTQSEDALKKLCDVEDFFKNTFKLQSEW